MNESVTITEISQFLSYVLRHQPQAIGLALDSEGWADINVLLAGAAAIGKTISHAQLQETVRTNDKQRFTLSADGLRIRAAQGHSTSSVALTYAARVPPTVLYHGTATRFLAAIRQQGLLPGTRHHVHLSADAAVAASVGRRHGVPAVLTVDAQAMLAAGHTFYFAHNGVWLTAAVPAAFLREATQTAN